VCRSLTLDEVPSFPVALRVRVPAWASRASVTVNGQPAEVAQLTGYVDVERLWESGDRVEVAYPRAVDVRRGQCLGQRILSRGDVAVVYGPHVYCAADRLNPAVRLHLVRVRWWGASHARVFVADASNRLEVDALDERGQSVRLVLSPLADVGGSANGIGRSHPVSTSPFRVWLPLAEAEPA
jgi:hypothetical protein